MREDASLTCNGYGGHLVTISKCDQLYHVSRILKDLDIDFYWIGLYRATTDDPFEWGDGDKSMFRSWAYARPTSASYLCVRGTVNSGGMDQWYDVPCTDERYAVCKLKGKCLLILFLMITHD